MGEESEAVMNADIPLLARVYEIMQDVVSMEEKCEKLDARKVNITQHLSWAAGGGERHGFDDVIAMIDEIQERHRLQVRQYIRELKRAEDIINGIESASMRTFVMAKYVDKLPDTEIRERLNMTRRSFDNAKHAVESVRCMADVRWRERYVLLPTGGENS